MTNSYFCSVADSTSKLYQKHYLHLVGRREALGRGLVGGTGVMQDRVIIGIIKVSKIPRPSITAPINLSDFFETPNSDYYFSFSQPAITCSKLTIKTLGQGVKHVQS